MQLQRTKLANGTPDVEAGSGTALPQGKWHSFISPIFIQALTLTFLAEWGDRSQLTTIILAAREVCRQTHDLFMTCCSSPCPSFKCVINVTPLRILLEWQWVEPWVTVCAPGWL